MDVTGSSQFASGTYDTAERLAELPMNNDAVTVIGGGGNGPEATKSIKSALSDSNSIVWNGPMDVTESSQFASGTYDTAEHLAELPMNNDAVTVFGGGDSVEAVSKFERHFQRCDKDRDNKLSVSEFHECIKGMGM